MRRVLLLALLLLGCDTRVVELSGSPDAGAPATAPCQTFVRDDGVPCTLCFGADGMVASTTCPPAPVPVAPVPAPAPAPPQVPVPAPVPPPAVPPVPAPTPPPVPGNPSAGSCEVTSGGDERCLLCKSSMSSYTVCLKCEPPAVRMGGGTCRVCAWSDDANNRCLQCFSRDGAREEDGCDGLRRESIRPVAADAGAGP
jgi:hypothetical protein